MNLGMSTRLISRTVTAQGLERRVVCTVSVYFQHLNFSFSYLATFNHYSTHSRLTSLFNMWPQQSISHYSHCSLCHLCRGGGSKLSYPPANGLVRSILTAFEKTKHLEAAKYNHSLFPFFWGFKENKKRTSTHTIKPNNNNNNKHWDESRPRDPKQSIKQHMYSDYKYIRMDKSVHQHRMITSKTRSMFV